MVSGCSKKDGSGWKSILNGRFWCRDVVVDERQFFIQISKCDVNSWLFQVSELPDGAQHIPLHDGVVFSLDQAKEFSMMAIELFSSNPCALPRAQQ